MFSRRKPRWVLYQENQEARAAASRDSRKSPAPIIIARAKASAEYAQALEAVKVAIDAFYDTDESDEELTARLRAEGGRSAIRRRIIAECGTFQFHQSELFGFTPISSFINPEDVQNFEAQALSRRRARQESHS